MQSNQSNVTIQATNRYQSKKTDRGLLNLGNIHSNPIKIQILFSFLCILSSSQFSTCLYRGHRGIYVGKKFADPNPNPLHTTTATTLPRRRPYRPYW